MKKSLSNLINDELKLKTYGDLVMVDGTLYPLPLVDGNNKIRRGIWHASTVPTAHDITATINGVKYVEKGTCPVTCPGCYATTGNYARFQDPNYYLIMRTRLLRSYPNIYFELVKAQIKCENIKYIRIHASGDFIENEAAGWYKIFKSNKDLSGWTYTIDYILKTYNKLVSKGEAPYICRCGIDKNQHCTNCTGCSKNKFVLFIEHGTEYKAEKDPLYNTIKELIESQPDQRI